MLFHRIGPYHFARLRALAKRLPTIAVEMSRSDTTYAWDIVEGSDGFERVTVFTDTDSRLQPRAEVVRRLQAVLEHYSPSAVALPGWADTEALAALSWCLAHGVPAVVMSESTEGDEKRVRWKEWLKGRVVRLCSAGLAGGAPHADYLAHLGLAKGRIFPGYDAVDNEHFANKASETVSRASETRARLKLPECYFLASARFVQKKNLARLIEAYAHYRQLAIKAGVGNPWSLVLLGDGPLRPVLEAQVAALNLQETVFLPGFKQYDELPAWYALAGAFVHASTTEQWGLVVNEAMAAGLPVLVSQRCGCAPDLVAEGINGFTFAPEDVEQLAQLMVRVAAPEFPLAAFGAQSRRIIQQWSPERFASGLAQAVEVARKAVMPQACLLDRCLLKALTCR